MLDIDITEVKCFYCRNNDKGFCRYYGRKIVLGDWLFCRVWT